MSTRGAGMSMAFGPAQSTVDRGRVWTEEEILEIWPQVAAELANFQTVLAVRANLTASQLGMALQLANAQFEALKSAKT